MKLVSHTIKVSTFGVFVAMLWTIFAILMILWLLGWGFQIGGSFVHLLLVAALILAVLNLIGMRRMG